MGINEILEDKREIILSIAEKHGAKNIRVFGSVARGDASEESDIDFLIEKGPNRTPFFPGGLIAELEEILGRKVDVVSINGIDPNIRAEILNEAKSI